MYGLTQLVGFGAASSPITSSFTGSFASSSDLSVYSSSVNVGSTSENKVVAVLAAGGVTANTRTLAGCTIGGQSATLVATNQDQNTVSNGIYLLSTTLTGSQTIAVTWSATLSRGGFGVYELINADTTIFQDEKSDGTTSVSTSSLVIPIGGVALAVANFEGGSSPTGNWGGLTENYAASLEGTHFHTGASLTTAGIPSISVSSSSATVGALTAISLGPA